MLNDIEENDCIDIADLSHIDFICRPRQDVKTGAPTVVCSFVGQFNARHIEDALGLLQKKSKQSRLAGAIRALPNEISKIIDLRQALRESAGVFCDLAELNDGTTDHNDVGKVRHLLESAFRSLDDTPIFVDCISTKSFLASKKGD